MPTGFAGMPLFDLNTGRERGLARARQRDSGISPAGVRVPAGRRDVFSWFCNIEINFHFANHVAAGPPEIFADREKLAARSRDAPVTRHPVPDVA